MAQGEGFGMEDHNHKILKKKFIQKLYCYRNQPNYWENPSRCFTEIGISPDSQIWHSLLDEGLLKTSQTDKVRITEKGIRYIEHPILYFFSHSETIKFVWGVIVFVGAITPIIEVFNKLTRLICR